MIKYQSFGIEQLMGVVCLSIRVSTNIALSVYGAFVCICPSIFCYHMNVHLCAAGVDMSKTLSIWSTSMSTNDVQEFSKVGSIQVILKILG